MDQKHLGKWIIGLREERGWSQMELAIRLKTGCSSVSRWERGVVAPHFAALRSICEVFGRSADEALGLPTRKAS